MARISNPIVYQIYVPSFYDSNNDGLGDLNGIRMKLPYLCDLSIDAITLTPFYPSPLHDSGYDITDYQAVHPQFGSLQDFDALIADAHNKNIKVIVDLVPNHTSNLHPWFLESCSSRNHPKRDWYIWKDPKPDGSPPSNWISVFSGSAWTFNQTTGQYYLHTFLPEQPDLNLRNPQVISAIRDVATFWLNRGVDGFRLDAVYHFLKNEEFADEPLNPLYKPGRNDPYDQYLHQDNYNMYETAEWINTNIASMLDDSHLLFTESYISVKEMNIMYSGISNCQYAPYNFYYLSLPWEVRKYKKYLDDYYTMLGSSRTATHIISNHDRVRAASRLGTKRAKLAAFIQCCLPGIPFIYYGDEIGMTAGSIPQHLVKDPWGKKVVDKRFARDPQRRPMQWKAYKYAGFSSSTPWLPIHQNYRTINVELELQNNASMLHFYKLLITFRKQHPVIANGTYVSLPQPDKKILSYQLEREGEKVQILANFSNERKRVNLHHSSILFSTENQFLPAENSVILQPYEGILLQ